MVRKLMILLIAFLLSLPAFSKDFKVNVFGGRNSIVVKQEGDGTIENAYLLKVGSRKYKFNLKGDQTFRVENLKEKSYKVVLKQQDKKSSFIPYKSVVQVYGNKYQEKLSPQQPSDAYLDPEIDELTIIWKDKTENNEQLGKYIGAEISYSNLRNQQKHLLLRGQRNTVVTTSQDVMVRLAYIPEQCIDTFYTSSFAVNAREISLEDKWKSFSLPENINVCIDDSMRQSSIVQLYAKILLDKPENDPMVVATEHKAENVNELVGNFDSFYKRVILRVVNVLYVPGDDIINIKQLTNMVGAMVKEKEGFDGATPAYLSHHQGKARMKLNAPYLENYYKRSNFNVLKNEQIGIFLHELTHAYQHYPNYKKTENADHYFVGLEGMADAVRFIAKGFGDKERIGAGLQGEKSEKKWLTPYRVSACFLMWLRNFDGDFVRKFHRTIKEIDHWSFDKAIHQILGEQYEAEQLWNLYLKDVKEEALEKGYLK